MPGVYCRPVRRGTASENGFSPPDAGAAHSQDAAMTTPADTPAGTPTGTPTGTPMPTSIRWEREWDAALARARAERRPLLVDVEKDH